MKLTSENLVKREVKDWLRVMGWFFFPLVQGIGSFPGLPDLIAVKDGHVLFIECKSEAGKQTGHQRDFQNILEVCGGCYVIARSCLDVQRVVDLLNPRRHRRAVAPDYDEGA